MVRNNITGSLFLLIISLASTTQLFAHKESFTETLYSTFGCLTLPLAIDVISKCHKNIQLDKALFDKSKPQFFSGITTGISYVSLYYAYKRGYLDKPQQIKSFKTLGLILSTIAIPITVNTITKMATNHFDTNKTSRKSPSTDVGKHACRGLFTGSLATTALLASLSMVPISYSDAATKTYAGGWSFFDLKY